MQAIREKSKERAVKENQKMIGKRLKKFPPSEYATGDQVYVRLLNRDQRVKRGGTSIVAPKVHDGTVIEADAKNYRYKISINHPDSRSETLNFMQTMTEGETVCFMHSNTNYLHME